MNEELKTKFKELIDRNEPIESENNWLIIIILLLLFPRKDDKGDKKNV